MLYFFRWFPGGFRGLNLTSYRQMFTTQRILPFGLSAFRTREQDLSDGQDDRKGNGADFRLIDGRVILVLVGQ